jgi:hypothetical protein
VLDEGDFEDWGKRGGRMPVNLRTIDAPPRSESRAVIVGPAATPPRRAARPADDSAQPLRDLQDPVEEPVRPEIKVDWSNPAGV